MSVTVQHTVQVDLYHEVVDFLYYEAELLDGRKYREWLNLLADDLRYEVPMRLNVSADERNLEITDPHDQICWFNEGKETLEGRVIQLESGVHWVEEPASRFTHFLSNVRLVEVELPEVVAHYNVLFYRNRVADEVELLAGKRRDRLRKTDTSWQVVHRYVLLDQSVLLPKNLAIPI